MLHLYIDVMLKILLIALAIMVSENAGAFDWPRFRGPNGTGVSSDRGLPAEIDRNKNLLWSVKIPEGNSSPIIIAQRIFLTAHVGEERFVLCLNSKGEEIWRKKVSRARIESFHPRNGPTTPTPATDGKNVSVSSRNSD